jgi:superfamily II DNA or RNA helicase
MTREEIQTKALELSKSHKHILLEWPTGIGKSKAAIDIALEHGGEWLLVCKETNHIDNWKKEFEKFGASEFWEENVVAICYASLHKHTDSDFNLILDEVHATTDIREEHIKTITPKKIVSLSATVDSPVKEKLKSICPFEEYKITTTEAIEYGILPEPTIYIVNIELGHLDDEYKKLSKNVGFWENKYKEDYAEWKRIKWLRSGLQRKLFLTKLKTSQTQSIIEELKRDKKRFICFTGSIEQCKELGDPDNLVHSKVDKLKRQKIIDDFNAGSIDDIYAVDMLKESMNLSKIDAGIIVQLDNGERSAIQQIGRVMRSIAPEIYILVVKNTQDEQYMDRALASIDKKYIKHLNI